MAKREQTLNSIALEATLELETVCRPELIEAIGQQAMQAGPAENTVVQLDDYRPAAEADFTAADIEAAREIEHQPDPLRAIRIRLQAHRLRHRHEHQAASDDALRFAATGRGQAAKAANHALLKPAEEIFLAKRIERGDLEAKSMLIESNIRLLQTMARKQFYATHLDADDSIHNGMIGLIRAVEKYDWRKGFRFTTYATIWIRQALQREYDNTEREIRLPAHVAQQFRRMRSFEVRHGQLHGGEPPSPGIIADSLGIPVKDVELLKHYEGMLVSLDAPASANSDPGDTASLGELILVDPSPTPEEDAVVRDQQARLEAALSQLPARQALAVRAHAGLIDGQEQTFGQIGRELGVSSQTAKNLYDKGLQRLEKLLAHDAQTETRLPRARRAAPTLAELFPDG